MRPLKREKLRGTPHTLQDESDASTTPHHHHHRLPSFLSFLHASQLRVVSDKQPSAENLLPIGALPVNEGNGRTHKAWLVIPRSLPRSLARSLLLFAVQTVINIFRRKLSFSPTG